MASAILKGFMSETAGRWPSSPRRVTRIRAAARFPGSAGTWRPTAGRWLSVPPGAASTAYLCPNNSAFVASSIQMIRWRARISSNSSWEGIHTLWECWVFGLFFRTEAAGFTLPKRHGALLPVRFLQARYSFYWTNEDNWWIDFV